jgi:hypothetical protein
VAYLAVAAPISTIDFPMYSRQAAVTILLCFFPLLAGGRAPWSELAIRCRLAGDRLFLREPG